MDWKSRSTGAPRSRALSCVVICASTQLCVGISYRSRMRSTIRSSVVTVATLSDTGLIPITASPAPSSSPSRIEAAIPAGSSVGWFGCSREHSVPGRPTVVRNLVTTRTFRATSTRSCNRMSLETAATISGVNARARPARGSPVASSSNSQSRNSPTVKLASGAKAARSCESRMSRVTSSSSYGITASVRNTDSGRSARAICAATRSAALTAAIPARSSPLRGGDALASSARRSSKV